MDMKVQNRRNFYRINFDGMANVEIGNENYDCCQVKNLSLTGMFVKGNFQQQVGDCLINLFHKEKCGNNSLQASGEIVWSNDEGVDLKFTTMSFENYILLQTTLINKAEQPATILRELPKDSPFEISNV
jgi:hypothetical protein